MDDMYSEIEVIGHGAFGQVSKVRRHQDGFVCCIKRVYLAGLSPRQEQEAVNEVHALGRCRHRNIVGYIDSFISNNVLHIVMELAHGGDLAGDIEEHTRAKQLIVESKIWDILIQVCEGLEYIHKIPLLHRDLKPKNIFKKQQSHESVTYVIGDLGFGRFMCEGERFVHSTVGTPAYSAPELLRSPCVYNHKVDMWALGCVIFELASLTSPFHGKTQEALHERIRHKPQQELPFPYSVELNFVVKDLLKKHQATRSSAEQILALPAVVIRKELARIRRRESHLTKELNACMSRSKLLEQKWAEERSGKQALMEQIAVSNGAKERKLRQWADTLAKEEDRLKTWEEKLLQSQVLNHKNLQTREALSSGVEGCSASSNETVTITRHDEHNKQQLLPTMVQWTPSRGAQEDETENVEKLEKVVKRLSFSEDDIGSSKLGPPLRCRKQIRKQNPPNLDNVTWGEGKTDNRRGRLLTRKTVRKSAKTVESDVNYQSQNSNIVQPDILLNAIREQKRDSSH
eukprot:m.336244 g.336244  ORF g.336244 m.336244 type:complete len:515 (+) comp17795_c0_seq1:255-1799(+)